METNQSSYKTDEELVHKTPNSFKNHPADNTNLEQMKNWLNTFATVCKINSSTVLSDNKIKEYENRLEISIPSTLRLIYSDLDNSDTIFSSKKPLIADYKLLPIDDLKIEKDVVIYDSYSGEAWYETDILIYADTLKGKKLCGIDLKKDWHLRYYKNHWLWTKDYMSLYQDLIVSLVCIAITNRQNIFKTRVKGLRFGQEIECMEERFSGDFERFSDFDYYGHTLFFNKQNGALGWFRAGMAPDLLTGCDDKTFVDKLIQKNKFDKAKFY